MYFYDALDDVHPTLDNLDAFPDDRIVAAVDERIAIAIDRKGAQTTDHRSLAVPSMFACLTCSVLICSIT